MNTPTPRTDAAYTQRPNEGAWDFRVRQEKTMESLERAITAAREEITLLKTNLKIQTNHTENAVQDRADEHIELHNQIQELTEQRDRLVQVIEAATILIAAKGRHNTMLAYNGLRDALQSLNEPTSL